MTLASDFRSFQKLDDIGRWHINRFVERVAPAILPGSRVLDAGAGEAAYESLFAHCRYVASDLAVGDATWNYKNLGAINRLETLPFRDGAFDAVVCTQVLEHVEWPRECVAEFHRVLRPGGTLYATVPMAHAEHQVPFDFFRYTSYGLRSILGVAGFLEIRIEPFGGLPTRLAFELPRLLVLFPPGGLRSGRPNLRGIALIPLRLVTALVIRLLQRTLLVCERWDRAKTDPFGWAAVATK